MTSDELVALLRSATEDDVIRALHASVVETPLSKPVDLLEFYNCMIDVLIAAGHDVDEANRHRIPPGFGSTD